MARIRNSISTLERQSLIKQRLAQAGELSYQQLARELRVSEMTVRRDMSSLAGQGEIIRVPGGAAAAKRYTFEFSFREKQQKNLKQKTDIAKRALRHVKDDQVLLLATGTTTLEIARQLQHQRKVKIITNSLAVVSELQFAPEIELILLGGFLRDGSPDLHGPLTEQDMGDFHADVAFLGADAIDANGWVFSNDLRIRTLDIAMARASTFRVVAADSSKFTSQAMCKILEPSDYDLLITDAKVDRKRVQRLRKKGIEIEIV